MTKSNHKLVDVLLEFVQAIEATGGVMVDHKGYHVPVADKDWIDLGEAYLKACEALGQEPMESESEENNEE